MVLYFATSPNQCFCTTWQNTETRKLHIFTQMLYFCFFQSFTERCMISLILLTHNSYLRWYRLFKSCNQLSSVLAFLLGAIAQKKLSWDLCAAACWTVLRTPCTGACTCMSCVAERQIILSSTTCSITANICWDSKISYQYCPLTFHLRLDKEQLPLLTQRPTSWRTW